MKALLVIAFGGLGALARYGAAVATGAPDRSFPWTTLAVNVVGCFLLGVLVGAVDPRREEVRLALGTGLLGGFTTFSAFSVEAVSLPAGRAAAYVAGSVAGGLAAAAAGRALGRAV